MKNTFYLLILFLLVNQISIAQIDQVSVGSAYSQQAYYTISTGEFETVDNEAWDIAFSNVDDTDAGIFINESATFMSSGLLLFVAPTTDWVEVLDDTSLFPDSIAIYNEEQNWTEGAFNSIKEKSDPFDYGWGSYNMTTHVIEGSRIFVVKKRDGSFIKFMVDQLDDGIYAFRYANLDGSNEVINSVSKVDAGDAPLIYFSFETNDLVDVPDDYDLIFTRYVDPIDPGTGEIVQYTVTGVLLGPGTQAVVAKDVDIETVDHADYENDYSETPNTIGHDWKYFDFSLGWVVEQNRVQFVKTKSGDIYQIIFFDFEGSSTGIITMEKTQIGSSANDAIAPQNPLNVFPNPFKEYIIIGSSADAEFFNLEIFNELGHKIYTDEVYTNERVNLPASWMDGIYFIRLTDESNRTQTMKLVK